MDGSANQGGIVRHPINGFHGFRLLKVFEPEAASIDAASADTAMKMFCSIKDRKLSLASASKPRVWSSGQRDITDLKRMKLSHQT